MAEIVNVDNFVRAETARMFDGLLAQTGGLDQWAHNRVPTSIDAQNVIRMNRDTLYSSTIADISEGATVTLPDPGERYMSAMVINEDHYINAILRGPGTHELSVGEFDTPYVGLVVRTFVDPSDPDDVAAVHELQDALVLDARSAEPYVHPDYEEESRTSTAKALLELFEGIPDARRTFGARSDVDPVRHLLGTASAWGGLPESEAFYVVETEPRSAGFYTLVLRDVPVDGFWSMSIYNRDGFFEENRYDSYSLNSVTAVADADGSVTLNMAPTPNGLENHLYVMDGWNYAFRLYRPRQSVLDGSWALPELTAEI